MKTLLILLVVVLSLVGISDAGYITYEEFSGIIPPCSNGFQCEKVLTSQWAHIGPIPLSLLGLGYYATVFTIGVLLYLGVKKIPVPLPIISDWPLEYFLLLLTSSGALFSLYLIFLMGVVIQGWCFYCLISATTSLALFTISAIIGKLSAKGRSSETKSEG